MPADAFIADDRSGVVVGATTADATSLEAPLKLSSIRLLDQADSSFEVTSQEPYAVLEAIGPSDSADRQVLMLGGWSPGNQSAPRALTDKLLDYLVSTGWPPLDGDLLLTDDSAPPFTVDSTTLTQEEATEAEPEERSYAKWFVAGVALLLLLLAFQVVISIRRDRKVAQSEDDEEPVPVPAGPAYLEDLEFREQNLPPDPPPAKRPRQEAGGEGPRHRRRPPTPPKVTKRSRNQKKKRASLRQRASDGGQATARARLAVAEARRALAARNARFARRVGGQPGCAALRSRRSSLGSAKISDSSALCTAWASG